MKLNEDVMMILGICAKINPHIVIKKGSRIESLTPARNRLVVADLPIEFPHEIAFADLSGFLRQVSLFDDPDFDFGERSVVITDAHGAKATYQYSNKQDLVYLDRNFREDGYHGRVELPHIAMDKILRASAANKTEDIVFMFEDGMKIKTMDKEDATRVFSVDLVSDDNFYASIKHGKKNKVQLLPLDYIVKISPTLGILQFAGAVGECDIKFFIACERDFKINFDY